MLRHCSLRWLATAAATASTIAAAGCNQAPSAESESSIATEQALVARSATCAITLPPNSDAGRYLLAANGSLTVADRAIVPGAMANMGTLGTQVGSDARVADIISRSTITLRDRALVTGNITTSVPLSASSFSKVLGTVNTSAQLNVPAVQSLPVEFPAAADVDVLLEPDKSATMAPGRYRNVRVKSRSTINLRTGTYYFETLEVLEPQATIKLDETQGPVIVFVNQPFAFRGVVKSTLAQPDWLLGIVQAGYMSIETPFQGTIVAPQAKLVFGTGSQKHTGAFFAKDIEIQPGVVLTYKPSSEVSRCSTVLGDVRPNDLTAEDIGTEYNITGKQIPVGFVHGIDECVNVEAKYVPGPGQPAVPTDYMPLTLFDHPECANTMKVCDANDVPTGAVVTRADLEKAPPTGSTCSAIPSVDRCLCPINPASIGAACETSSQCAAGYVCATVCEAGPNCTMPRRCGRYVEGCTGLPEETNCQETRICPSSESVGTVTDAELRADLKPKAMVADTVTQPVAPDIAHFQPLSNLIALNTGDGCGFEAKEIPLPLTKQSEANGTSKGKKNWGVSFEPKLAHDIGSKTIEPFGLVMPKLKAEASLKVGATVWGASFNVFSAVAAAGVDGCVASAKVQLEIGPTGDASDGDNRKSADASRDLCGAAFSTIKDATTILTWAEAQALDVAEYYKNYGPNKELCKTFKLRFLEAPVDCEGDPQVAAKAIVKYLGSHYASMATQAKEKADAFSTALKGIDQVSVGQSMPEHVFYDKPLEVMGGEANFPIGPFIVTVGGSVDAHFAVKGRPQLNLDSKPGQPANIGVAFVVTPSANLDATAFVGVGFKVVTAGVQGDIHLVGANLPITASVGVVSQAAPDSRNLADDGYSAAMSKLGAEPALAALAPTKFKWGNGFSMSGAVTFDKFLSGQLDGFVRINLWLYKKTFKRKITNWKGIEASSGPIQLFGEPQNDPFAAGSSEYATAPKVPYLRPVDETDVTFPATPVATCVPANGTSCPRVPAITNLTNRLGDKTNSLCNPAPPIQ